MTQTEKIDVKMSDNLYRQKILLAILPFWTPLIPPLGISCIKSYIRQNGFHNVKTVDANMELEFRNLYYDYFNVLKKYIPEEERGNFYSVGNDVWQNHMMAYLNYTDESEYIELVKTLVFTIYFRQLTDEEIEPLHQIISKTYTRLEKYIIDLLEKEKPDTLALGVYIGTLPASLFAFQLARKRYPKIKNVMGGGVFYDQLAEGSPHLESFLEKTKDYIDVLLMGEGEVLFLNYLQGKLDKSRRFHTHQDIAGKTLDLTEPRIPDFSDLPINEYPYLSVYGSRSCPYRCTFCSDSVFWGKYRYKKPKQIVEEFTRLHEQYNYQLFYMSDLLLNPIITKLAQECLKVDVSFYWDGFIKVSDEVCDPEKAFLWRRGGLYRVGVGLESGSQRILDLMDKRITVEQSKASIINLANAGIKTTTFWIIGYPGETEEDFQMTLDFLEELKDYIYYAEGNVFWSLLEGRPKSDEWLEQGVPLYSERFTDMLMFEVRMMDTVPSREERYKRMVRFVNHCKKLGIQNSYSWNGIYKVDKRWKSLHENAAPSLAEFTQRNKYIDENKKIKWGVAVKSPIKVDGDWLF